MRDAFLAEHDVHYVRGADFVCDARLRRVCGTHRITYHSIAASLNTRESQIRAFFSAHNCNILSMVGATSNETSITFHGLCPSMHYMRYFFDLDEYERTSVSQPRNSAVTSNEDFDIMDGLQFEKFCAEIVRQNGYENVTATSGSGDQGVDIIAYRDGVKYGIQCKCYSSDIGNKAVQEVFAGKTFYQCHVGIVLTNSYFTKSAIELAHRNGVILWDRDKLLKLIEVANKKQTY